MTKASSTKHQVKAAHTIQVQSYGSEIQLVAEVADSKCKGELLELGTSANCGSTRPQQGILELGSKGAGGAGLKAKCVCFNNAGPMLNRTEATTTV